MIHFEAFKSGCMPKALLGICFIVNAARFAAVLFTRKLSLCRIKLQTRCVTERSLSARDKRELPASLRINIYVHLLLPSFATRAELSDFHMTNNTQYHFTAFSCCVLYLYVYMWSALRTTFFSICTSGRASKLIISQFNNAHST